MAGWLRPLAAVRLPKPETRKRSLAGDEELRGARRGLPPLSHAVLDRFLYALPNGFSIYFFNSAVRWESPSALYFSTTGNMPCRGASSRAW